MLLTEWHPRALHFPPGDDENELIVRDEVPGADGADADSRWNISDLRGRRIESWLEPAWRSDRMCWMLLGNALALSFELGVFDDFDDTISYGGEMYRPEYDSQDYRLRARRAQKLLLIYVTQLAGRLGWTNMVPRHLTESEFFKTPGQKLENKRKITKNSDDASGEKLDDTIQHCWIEITTLMKQGNELLFPTRKHTREIIQSGRYVHLLEFFQPMLRSWKSDFEKLNCKSTQCLFTCAS
jgi:hypothetical protein